MSAQAAGLALVLGASAIAAYTDLTTRRIPNVLCGGLLACGLALSAFAGWYQAAVCLMLFVAVFALGTFLFSLKLIGGGDVKMLAASAATLGWPDAAAFLLYTILAGGVIGVAIAAARGRMRPMLAAVKAMAVPMMSGLKPGAVASAAGSMPYGVAIFAGAAVVVACDTLGLSLRMLL